MDDSSTGTYASGSYSFALELRSLCGLPGGKLSHWKMLYPIGENFVDEETEEATWLVDGMGMQGVPERERERESQ